MKVSWREGGNLWLVRHGERQDSAAPGLLSARSPNPPLSASGHREAAALAGRLKSEALRNIVASPFTRTVQTAAPVCNQLGRPLILEPGVSEFLHESFFTESPVWLTSHDVEVQRMAVVDHDYEPQPPPVFPESEAGFLVRCYTTLESIMGTLGPDLLVVTHGVCITVMVSCLFGRRMVLNTEPAALVRVEWTGRQWELRLAGDRTYLDSDR